MLSGLGITAEVKLEKLWYTGKLSWGEKNSWLQLLSLPQLFPESDSLFHMGMLPKLLSYSGEETERSATSRGQPEAWVLRGCSTLSALSFFGWHNASEFHRTQLQKTRVWIISRHSHFAGMRTFIFKSVLFLPFSLESIKPNSTKSIRRADCPSENNVAQVNDVSQLGFLLL